jgi:hypothetical protein
MSPCGMPTAKSQSRSLTSGKQKSRPSFRKGSRFWTTFRQPRLIVFALAGTKLGGSVGARSA